MSLRASVVTVGVSATILHEPEPDAIPGATLAVKVPPGGATVYLGGPDVTTATGWPVAAGESLFLDLNTGDSPLPVETEDIVYAVTALNTQDVNVLISGLSKLIPVIQTITLSDTPWGATFTLSIGDWSTEPITVAAASNKRPDPVVIQQALVGTMAGNWQPGDIRGSHRWSLAGSHRWSLMGSPIGTHDVQVTGPKGGPYTVTFAARLGFVPLMTATVTPASAGTVTIEMVQSP